MIIKRSVHKSGVIFRRVKYKYNMGGFLCQQYECINRNRYVGGRGDNPICNLCDYVRHKFAYIKNLYIPDYVN